MLLPEKPNPVEHLARSSARRFQPFSELRVFKLEPLDALGRQFRAAARAFNRLHTSFCLKRSAAKGRQLVAEVTDELLKLEKRFDFRTIAVGFQVCSRVR